MFWLGQLIRRRDRWVEAGKGKTEVAVEWERDRESVLERVQGIRDNKTLQGEGEQVHTGKGSYIPPSLYLQSNFIF